MLDYSSFRLALPNPLLTASLHPSEPILATGLSSGHVQVYRLPSEASTTAAADSDSDHDSDDDTSPSPESQNSSEFSLLWKTRRHKPTVRAVSYTCDGRSLLSAGTDTLFKVADSSTGKVSSKYAIPTSATNQKKRAGDPSKAVPDAAVPTVIDASINAHTALMGTEAGTILRLDLRTPKGFVEGQVWSLDPAEGAYGADTVSSIVPLPGLEGGEPRQIVATGGVVLAVFDIRKPGKTIVTSEMQEDDILCATWVPYWPGRTGVGNSRGRILTGMAEGMAGVWRRGEWEDHGDRINVCKKDGDSVDSIIGIDGLGIVAGTGGGKVKVFKVGGNKVLGELTHSTEEEGGEGVGFVGEDTEGRLVSAGGECVRVWYKNNRKDKAPKGSDDEDDSDADSDDSDASEDESDIDSEEEHARRKRKRKGLGARKGPKPAKNVKMTFEGLD
ncbi:hypothetical protein BJ508DRAFT_302022 [Ascobolus immersus RN42]|uniref:WD repeat-containing protein JIP5 n=1 Tax=Ascobolus immersus RN42 TaxID=1160509 RepID=A0A3N4IKB5_ASCIM|nr:hypothetical protein BJ508DRAFT_302022 [Ascobolus immersus RN42]